MDSTWQSKKLIVVGVAMLLAFCAMWAQEAASARFYDFLTYTIPTYVLGQSGIDGVKEWKKKPSTTPVE